jgi:hypothetical protein
MKHEIITYKEKDRILWRDETTVILFEFWQQGDPVHSASVFDEVFK